MPESSTDPQVAQPQPPYPRQRQQPPGGEEQLRPEADHGEASYKGYHRLEGKAVLITGADSGIGRAVGLAYAREGADVLISYLNEEKDALVSARLVRDAGRKAVCLPGDIGQADHCKKLVERCLAEFGKIDVLINNAAFQARHETLEEFSDQEFELTFRTNVFGMFYLCKAAMPFMQSGASIINTSSIQAYQPSADLLAYASTKGAIVTFSKALAVMAIEKGVRVNVVAPGPVWTPLIPSTTEEEDVEKFGQKAPIGRAAQPAELAPIFVFLALPEASYITGEVFGVGGGMFYG